MPGNPRQNSFGAISPGDLTPFKGGSNITTAMSAPAVKDRDTMRLDERFTRAEFVVRTPAGVTSMTIHYGRWVEGGNHSGAGTDLNGWLEDGTEVKGSLSDGEIVSITMDTHGDQPAIYVTDIVGAPSEPLRMWVRGL